MAFTGKSLADGQLAATKGTLYTSSVKTIIKSINVYNTAVTSETVNIYVKRSGGTSRQLFRAVLAQDEYAWVLSEGETLVLSASDEIEGDSTNATSVDYAITGATE